MATIKISDSHGVKEIKCFETLDTVPYLTEDEELIDDEPKDNNPFE